MRPRIKPGIHPALRDVLRDTDGLLRGAPDSAAAREAWRALFARHEAAPGDFAALPVGDACLLVDLGLRLHMTDGEYDRAGALLELLFSHPRAGRMGKTAEAIFRCKKGEALLASGEERQAVAAFGAVAAGVGDGRYHRDALDNVVYRLYGHARREREDGDRPPSRALADFVGQVADAFGGSPRDSPRDSPRAAAGGVRDGPHEPGHEPGHEPSYEDLAARLEAAFPIPDGWRRRRDHS